jgi:hypothetical protein
LEAVTVESIQAGRDGSPAQDTPAERAARIIGSHFCILSTMLGMPWDEACDAQLAEVLAGLAGS